MTAGHTDASLSVSLTLCSLCSLSLSRVTAPPPVLGRPGEELQSFTVASAGPGGGEASEVEP